jgi:hypothetical protein
MKFLQLIISLFSNQDVKPSDNIIVLGCTIDIDKDILTKLHFTDPSKFNDLHFTLTTINKCRKQIKVQYFYSENNQSSITFKNLSDCKILNDNYGWNDGFKASGKRRGIGWIEIDRVTQRQETTLFREDDSAMRIPYKCSVLDEKNANQWVKDETTKLLESKALLQQKHNANLELKKQQRKF